MYVFVYLCVCVWERVFYYFYCGSAIAWLISCPTSVSRGTCKAHDKSGIFCMGHSYSARHNSERGSRGVGREEKGRPQNYWSNFLFVSVATTASGTNKSGGSPHPATLGALHLLLSGKQTNKFSALTPLPRGNGSSSATEAATAAAAELARCAQRWEWTPAAARDNALHFWHGTNSSWPAIHPPPPPSSPWLPLPVPRKLVRHTMAKRFSC